MQRKNCLTLQEKKKKRQDERETQQEGDEQAGQEAGCATRRGEQEEEEEERPQSLHEKLWVLVVCDNMKIVDVPEEGRRCFILREAEPQRKVTREQGEGR